MGGQRHPPEKVQSRSKICWKRVWEYYSAPGEVNATNTYFGRVSRLVTVLVNFSFVDLLLRTKNLFLGERKWGMLTISLKIYSEKIVLFTFLLFRVLQVLFSNFHKLKFLSVYLHRWSSKWTVWLHPWNMWAGSGLRAWWVLWFRQEPFKFSHGDLLCAEARGYGKKRWNTDQPLSFGKRQ